MGRFHVGDDVVKGSLTLLKGHIFGNNYEGTHSIPPGGWAVWSTVVSISKPQFTRP